MPQRYKLIVAYDGAPFSGWQSQADGNAIQDHLERAITKISGERVRVHGAGRTDAGVHALAQVAHVDLAKKLPPEKWLRAINSALPPTIRVMRCTRVSGNFHARFSARGKVYRYRIWRGEILPPVENGRAWHVREKIDIGLLDQAVGLFAGEHDFRSFSANRGQAEKTTRRTIRSIRPRKRGELLEIDIEGDGFLYRMARMMVGALVDSSTGKTPLAEISSRLAGRQVRARTMAPAHGLFLVRVRY